jgi:lipopolysaccharide transport system permease protein
MSAAQQQSDAHVGGIIEPPGGWALPNLRELWDYRDLLFFMARRHIAVRYQETVVGIAWAVIQPLGFALILSAFLGLVLDAPTAGVPRAAYVLCGMTIWIFFAETLSRSTSSTIESAALITKIYFPRLIIPIAALATPILDFACAFVVLVVFLLAMGVVPDLDVLVLPAVVVLALLTAFGAGLWLSAIAVRYRDVQIAVPFIVQIGLFATPVLYSLDVVPDAARPFFALNPMVGVLEGFRWALLPDAPAPGPLLIVPVVVSVVLVVSGVLYFTRAERTFADVV